jgi:hypothetical protein
MSSGTVPVKLFWREPMRFVEDCLTDPTLMTHSHFHPERKWLHAGFTRERMIDEPWTADVWWEIMVCINQFLTTTKH